MRNLDEDTFISKLTVDDQNWTIRVNKVYKLQGQIIQLSMNFQNNELDVFVLQRMQYQNLQKA